MIRYIVHVAALPRNHHRLDQTLQGYYEVLAPRMSGAIHGAFKSFRAYREGISKNRPPKPHLIGIRVIPFVSED